MIFEKRFFINLFFDHFKYFWGKTDPSMISLCKHFRWHKQSFSPLHWSTVWYIGICFLTEVNKFFLKFYQSFRFRGSLLSIKIMAVPRWFFFRLTIPKFWSFLKNGKNWGKNSWPDVSSRSHQKMTKSIYILVKQAIFKRRSISIKLSHTWKITIDGFIFMFFLVICIYCHHLTAWIML